MGVSHAGPAATKFGRNYWENRQTGFRIWVDPYLREKVFLSLFPEAVMGALRERPELKYPNYGFPECAANPFPQTQSHLDGTVLSADSRCAETIQPDSPSLMQGIISKEDYKNVFFECGNPITGNQHWTIVGSFKLEAYARTFATEIDTRYPDVAVELWGPRENSQYWRVMTAACTTRERAEQAKQTAIRRGFAPDAFVFELAPLWERIAP